MKKIYCGILTLLFLTGSASVASATYMADVSYDYIDNGGGDYLFSFTVSNTSTDLDSSGLGFFYINFDADSDYDSYTSLTWEESNFWFADTYVPYHYFGFDEPGGVWADDAVVFGGTGGLGQGESATYAVSFSYSGTLDPWEQNFSWGAEFGANFDGTGIWVDADLNGIEDPAIDYYIMGGTYGVMSYSSIVPPTPTPEPGTMMLFGSGLVGFASMRRKRKA